MAFTFSVASDGLTSGVMDFLVRVFMKICILVMVPLQMAGLKANLSLTENHRGHFLSFCFVNTCSKNLCVCHIIYECSVSLCFLPILVRLDLLIQFGNWIVCSFTVEFWEFFIYILDTNPLLGLWFGNILPTSSITFLSTF